jgi:hypothetical protein
VEAQRERTVPAGRALPADGFLRHRGLIALAVGGAPGSAPAMLLIMVPPHCTS